MISNYIKFDMVRFIADYYFFKALLPELESQLKSLDGMKGIDTTADKVKSSPSSDTTSKVALQRINLNEKIQSYKKHINLFERARETLTYEEKEVLEILFESDLPAVIKAEEVGLSKTTLYERRRNAFEKIKMFIIG